MKLTRFIPVLAATMLLGSCGGKTLKTAEKVAGDISANITEAAGQELALEYDEEQDAWGIALNVGTATDETEATLKPAVLFLEEFLPDYVEIKEEVYGDPTAEGYVDIFGDQSYYFYAGGETKDGAVQVEIVSYAYPVSATSNALVGQIMVYNTPAN